MKRKIYLLAVLSFLAGLVAGVVVGWKAPLRVLLAALQGETSLEADEAGEEDGARQAGEASGRRNVVRLSDSVAVEFGIVVGAAGPGMLQTKIRLPGQIGLNRDRTVDVAPLSTGVVRRVNKVLGDAVRAGEELAVIESGELGEARAAYLSAVEQAAATEAEYNREKELWASKISARQEYEKADAALREARINLRAAEQKLFALGLTGADLNNLASLPSDRFNEYRITAPLDGVVIEKNIVLGQAVEAMTEIYEIADLSTVWADLEVYPDHLSSVRPGQSVEISSGLGQASAVGEISYLGPILGEQTRTALARVVLPNAGGQWRPGTYVSGVLVVGQVAVAVAVPKSALQLLDGNPCVFVKTAEGFAPRLVKLGREDDQMVEILDNLAPGQEMATEGTFTLKAELIKSTFGGDAD